MSSATVQVTPVSGQPARLLLKPNQPAAPADPATLPVFLNNFLLLQIYTARSAQFPASTVSFEGQRPHRTATFTYCRVTGPSPPAPAPSTRSIGEP